MSNPFSLVFGKEPKMFINTFDQFESVKNDFLDENPTTNTYLISGVRGSGKTVLLTRLQKFFESEKDWLVIDLNPEIEMIEYLTSSIYEKANSKFKMVINELNFSFNVVGVTISNKKPVSNIITLLEKQLDIIKQHNKKVLICIDDVVSNANVKAFVQQFQILTRKDYPVFLLMTGLYENVRSLQNSRSLTFLYRAPQIYINKLSLIGIAESYEKELKVSYNDAVNFAKLTNGYAFAYQVLGYILFDLDKKEINDSVLEKFDTYLREYVYEKIYYDLPKSEKEVVVAMASNTSSKTIDIIESIDISREKMSQYRAKLIKKGLIVKSDWGKVDFALPRFREYVLKEKAFE